MCEVENTICDQFFALCSSLHHSRIFEDALAVDCVTNDFQDCVCVPVVKIVCPSCRHLQRKCNPESCVSVSCGDFFLTRNSMTVRCRNDAELRLFPSRLAFIFINYLFYFPFSFSHFFHIYIFLSRSQNFLLQCSTDKYTSPCLLQPASTLLAGITLLRTYHRPYVPYINCMLDLPSFTPPEQEE